MPLSVGTLLGPYEILSLIGAGGMGEVYRARDTRLDRTVAIKVLHAGFGSQPDARQRFEREARAVSSLNHPHICTLHDIGRQDSIDFLVMECLAGETLQSRLQRGPLSIEQAIRHGIEIASALAEAHGQGILHRDVKPANIMLTRNGAKLLDFGLAKLRASDVSQPTPGSVLTTVSVDQTARGTILGTIQYMSPEQLEGKELDARADIFALGLVLYEMATSRRAFTGSSQAALVAAIMHAQYKPISDGPPAFAHVVSRCLAVEPASRWHAAADVKLELEWVAAEGLAATASAPAISRRWLIASAAAGAGAFALGIGIGGLRRTDLPRPDVYRFNLAPPPGAEFHRTPNHHGLALSPDGRTLLFLAIHDGQTSFWVQSLDSPSARQLPGTEGATTPCWSPDGRSIAFFAAGSLKRLDLDGGNPQTLCDIKAPRGATWGPHGEILFAPMNSTGAAIFRIASTGGQAVPVTTDNPGEAYPASPKFLQDGRHFLYWIGGARSGTYVGSLDDPKLKVRVPSNGYSQSARAGAAGPDYLFWPRDEDLVAQEWDSKSYRLLGEPVTIGGPVGVIANEATFSISQGGVLVYQGRSDLQAEWVDRAGKPVGRAVGDRGFLQTIRQSPDGRKVAVCLKDSLMVTDVVRGVTGRIATGISGQNLVWSPDSTKIAFARGGAIVMIDSRGAGEIALTPADGNEPACWTPDGNSVLFVARRRRSGPALWIVAAKSGAVPKPVLDSTYLHVEASLSPDGRWLAYSSDESGHPEVYARRFDERATERIQISAAGGDFPQWRSDGRELFYLARDGFLTAVVVKPAAGTPEFGRPNRLFPLPASYISAYAYDASADGQQFLILTSHRLQPREPLTVIVNWPALLRRPAR